MPSNCSTRSPSTRFPPRRPSRPGQPRLSRWSPSANGPIELPPVYSLRFAEIAPGPSGVISVTVPASVVWIVRDIDALCVTGDIGGLTGFTVAKLGGAVLFGVDQYHARAGELYPWRGRQVYSAGEELQIVTNDDDWSLIMSGYQLTAP